MEGDFLKSFTVWELACSVVLSVLLGLSFRAWLLKGSYKGNPTNWPLLGMLPALLHNTHHIYTWATPIVVNNGGSFMFHGPWLSGMRYLFTAEPRNVQHALSSNFHNYTRGADIFAVLHDTLGDGIFNADGHLWQKQRKIASLQLHSCRCKEYMDSTVFDMVDKKLIPTLHHFCKERRKVDLQDLLLRFTFDATCMVVFGLDTGCFSPDLPAVPFAKAVDAAFECLVFRFSLPSRWWKALRWLRLGKERHMPHALDVINKFCDDAIISSKSRKVENDEGACNNTQQADLVSCFLRMGGDISHDEKLLRDLAVNLLFAGRDTTALALAWFFWLLAEHPDVQEKVAAEARRVINQARKEGKLVLSRKELDSMHYLHAALTESLRLHPSVPLDIRQAVKDDTFPDGNCVRGGDKVVYSIYIMGRMESIWGPDSTSFRPERWINPSDGRFTDTWVSPFEYLPFNAGPRTCIGKDMAFLLMKSLASMLLYHFKISLVPGHKVKPRFSSTLYMANGLLVTMECREPSSMIDA